MHERTLALGFLGKFTPCMSHPVSEHQEPNDENNHFEASQQDFTNQQTRVRVATSVFIYVVCEWVQDQKDIYTDVY